MEYSMIFFGIW